MPLNSGQCRVFQIPELLCLIFEHLSTSSTFSAALVCHFWSDIALDSLWRVVYKPEHLFRLLGNLMRKKTGLNTGSNEREEDSEGSATELDLITTYEWERQYLEPWRHEHRLLSFVEPPTPENWRTFNRYAYRVRHLVYSRQCLSKSAFDDIARTRPRTAILSNMHTLTWTDNPLCLSVILMHPGIKTLTLGIGLYELDKVLLRDIPSPSAPSIEVIFSTYFQSLPKHIPNLTSFSICSIVPISIYQAAFISLLTYPQWTKSLRKITLPRYYTTAGVLEAVAAMHKLEVLEFQYYIQQGVGKREDVQKGECVPTDWKNGRNVTNMFPALYDVSLTVNFDDAGKLLRNGTWADNLTMLYIDSGALEDPTDIRSLLGLLADRCQCLTTLGIISLGEAVGEDEAFLEALEGEAAASTPSTGELDLPMNRIRLHTISPIFDLPLLASFEVLHRRALYLSQTDVEIIAKSLPDIERLTLNEEPVQMFTSTLTLEALLPFARYCKRLKHLGLFMDATKGVEELVEMIRKTTFESKNEDKTEEIKAPQPSTASWYPRFARLERLSVGVSIIDVETVVYENMLELWGNEHDSEGEGGEGDHDQDSDSDDDSSSSSSSTMAHAHRRTPSRKVSMPYPSPIAEFLSYIMPLPPLLPLTSGDPESMPNDVLSVDNNREDEACLQSGVTWPDSLPVTIMLELVIYGRCKTWERVMRALPEAWMRRRRQIEEALNPALDEPNPEF